MNDNDNNDVSVSEWVKWYGILFLPIINIIIALKWSNDDTIKPSLRNAAKAFVMLTTAALAIWFTISLIALIVSYITTFHM